MCSAEFRTSCDRALEHAAAQYRGFCDRYRDARRIPRSSSGGRVHFVEASDWTSGFVAGSLWYLFEATGAPEFRDAAERFTRALEPQQYQTDTHDVGFMLGCSFGNGLRLTGRAEYAQVLGRGARSLSSRFNPRVGAIRSWDFGAWSFPVIVDNLMNLELLFRASALGFDPAFAEIARSHLGTTRRDHYRADFSAYHLVDYQPETGAVIKKQTRQGLFDESVWARGQAWGLYGFTLAFRESRQPEFLEQALAIAEFLISNQKIPADGVPYFDFDAPSTPGVPLLRDASSAAICASALFELASLVRAAPIGEHRSQTESSGAAPSTRSAERLLGYARRLVESLSSPAYLAPIGQNSHFLLMHSVGDYPRGTELDAALNYADYYYLEALLRARA